MRILLVEDHRSLSELLEEQFSRAGYIVDAASTGADALSAIRRVEYDVMILDLGLPKMDGITVLKSVRTSADSALPVIILTARDDVESRIEGLNEGADDYVAKPFDWGELEARVRAVLRRPGPRRGEILEFENLSLDAARKDARVNGEQLDLARREYALLEELLRAAPRIVVKDQLEDRLYTVNETVTPNAIEATVSRLRKKLAVLDADVRIATVRGIGYKMLPGPAGADVP